MIFRNKTKYEKYKNQMKKPTTNTTTTKFKIKIKFFEQKKCFTFEVFTKRVSSTFAACMKALFRWMFFLYQYKMHKL